MKNKSQGNNNQAANTDQTTGNGTPQTTTRMSAKEVAAQEAKAAAAAAPAAPAATAKVVKAPPLKNAKRGGGGGREKFSTPKYVIGTAAYNHLSKADSVNLQQIMNGNVQFIFDSAKYATPLAALQANELSFSLNEENPRLVSYVQNVKVTEYNETEQGKADPMAHTANKAKKYDCHVTAETVENAKKAISNYNEFMAATGNLFAMTFTPATTLVGLRASYKLAEVSLAEATEEVAA